jgi:hypothetical protein
MIMASEAWNKSRRQADVRQNSMVTFVWLEKELRGTDSKSIEIINYQLPSSAISFLSSFDANLNRMDYDYNNMKMIWKRYIIFYLAIDKVISPGQNPSYPSGFTLYKLMRKDVTLEFYSPPDTFETQQLKEMYYPPDGILTAASAELNMLSYITASPDTYISAEKTISRNIYNLEFAKSPDDNKIEVHIITRTSEGRDNFNIKNNIWIRNNSQ